jgi:micrococcal nuclease
MTSNTYTGRVLDNENKTVDSAKVTLELDGKSYIVHSDSEGFYQFNADLNGNIVSARMRVEAEGHKKYNRNIVLSSYNKIEEIHLTPEQKKSKNSLDKIVGIVTATTAIIGTFIAAATFFFNSSTTPPISNNPDTSRQNCDPAYPDFCISKDLPDLQCSDIKQRKFRVLPPDPHRFDGDKNGIGCEKN